ncbi:hypothetical protein [Motiliproteus coralliicola]|nr:hypothetical protein [Motiliproteus coralliicola]
MDYLIPAIELAVIGLILLALLLPSRKKKPTPSADKDSSQDG